MNPNPTNPTDALLPCPFCASKDVELRVSVTDEMIACNNCGCRTGFIFLGANDASNAFKRRELIAVWDTRPTITKQPCASDVEQARELLAKHLRKLNGSSDADEVMRGEWDNGASIKAIAEVLEQSQ